MPRPDTKHIAELDAALRTWTIGTPSSDSVRKRVCTAMQGLAGLRIDSRVSITETIKRAAKQCPSEARRSLATVLIRLVGMDGFLSPQELQACRLEIVGLVEGSLPDLTKGIFQSTDQNHEKIDAIGRIHRAACDHLDQLIQPFASLHDLARRRQTIMQSMKHGRAKNYLNAFGYSAVLPLVDSVLGRVASIENAEGHRLQATMTHLIDDLPTQIRQCEEIGTFVSTQYALPFLECVQSAATSMNEELAAGFACTISVPSAAREIEKKYPLHIEGSTIELSLVLNNDGPGVAQNVSTYCVVDHSEIRNPETTLGTVEPGPFVVTIQVRLTQPLTSLQADVEVTWEVVGDPRTYRETFTTIIRGQRTDIDWARLASRQPYSLEVAYDEDFYGRKDILNRIVRRMTSEAMQSCYISGQKRVGKSSLARAVQATLASRNAIERYHVLYLECGEIMHASGEQTLAELGRQLEYHFSRELNRDTTWESMDYSSSLSPLNRLLDMLGRENANNRFVIIFDEFDEINESLYSYGELANTFFLNLRTLASKPNVAFVLVGAEKMPYVMSSQGERLNKFDRESLDSFDQETEWSDFASLVRDPLDGTITLHDRGLRKLYALTDGHPYFTKALCAQIYESALDSKDAEISDIDVEKSAQRLVGSLGINAFAHYWRDGTRGGTEEVEIASVRRCRTLVSWARTVRSRARPTREEIERHIYGGLRVDDLGGELDDLCRRGVFREEAGQYWPAVGLFGRWLSNGGFLRLVDGQVGDQLEEKRQRDEDSAFVRADEVVELVRRWPLYQGRRLTEDMLRAWIDQVETNVERRQLFKMLQNTRFVSDEHLLEGFEAAYRNMSRRLPVLMREKRSDRRQDVLVTFVGGVSKSGAHYAAQFAKASLITHANVVTAEKLASRLDPERADGIAAVVIVDDMIGTGNTLTSELERNQAVFDELGVGARMPLFVCVFSATSEGEAKVRRHLDRNFADSDLEVYEPLDERHFAFGEGRGFWDTDSEKQMAKALATDLGARVDRRRPLGFRGQGLLLTFSRNCPNNSLPILFGSGKGTRAWMPLFPRVQL